MAASVLGLAGCPSPFDWSVYEGVNLIAERGFGASQGGTSVWQESDEGAYVTLEAAASGEFPSGAPGPSYRLELINLIPDGDFEETNPGDLPSAWSEIGTTNATVMAAAAYNADNDASEGVDLAAFHEEQVLSVDYEDTNARLYLDLAADGNLTVPGAYQHGAQFAFFLDFRMRYPTFPLALNSDGTPETDARNQYSIQRGGTETETNRSTTSYRFPGTDQTNDAQYSPASNTLTIDDLSFSRFSFGGDTETTAGRTEMVIDNLRLVRADLTHEITLDVPLVDALQPERPRILSGGSYELRFSVARDLSVTNTNNRFDARYMTITVESAAAGAESVLLNEAEGLEEFTNWGTGSGDAGWTELVYQFSGPQIPFGTQGDDPVMRIRIAFGSNGSPDHIYPGAFMISAPELRLITP